MAMGRMLFAVLLAAGCGRGRDASSLRSQALEADRVVTKDLAEAGMAAATGGAAHLQPIVGLGYDDDLERFPVLSGTTPDGRVAFAAGSGDGSLLFVPVRQPKAGTNLSAAALDGWVRRAGRFELKYTGATPVSPDGRPFEVGFSNQAAVGFDPRFGLAPLRVRNATDCLKDRTPAAYRSDGAVGPFLCYKLIVYVASARKKADDTLDRMLFASRLALVVTPGDAPAVEDGVFYGAYRATESKLKNGRKATHHGLEVSVTADSRLVIWNAPFFPEDKHVVMASFSPTPWAFATFDEPVALPNLHRAYASKTACLDPEPPAQGCKQVRLADFYKIARKPLREPAFGRPLYDVNQTFRCAYGWITPDGDNLFCSINGIHTYVVGEDTQHVLFPLDGAINGFHQRAEYDAGPKESFVFRGRTISDDQTFGGFPSVREKRLEMPLFLGQDAGLWRAFPDTATPEPVSRFRRTRTFHMLLRHGKLEVFDPRSREVLAKDRPDQKAKVSSFAYTPVSLDGFVDGQFLFVHQFAAVRPEIRQEKFDRDYAKEVADLMMDGSGRFNSVRLTDATDERAFSKNPDAFEYYYTNEGYRGQGLHLTLPSGAAQVLDGGSKGAVGAPALSLEVAFKLERGAAATRLPLVALGGSLSVSLENDRIVLRDTGLVLRAESAVTKGTWYHVGATVSVNGAQRDYELYVDGRRVAKQSIAGGAVRVTAAGGALAVLGPAGSCDGCKGRLVLDELAVSTTLRSADYFRTAAYQALPPSASVAEYPYEIPAGAAKADVYLPPELGLGELGPTRSRRLAALGSRLFRDEALSIGADGRSQGVSCATCHDPDRAFTDGRTLAQGVDTLSLNSPTLVNRALAKAQFFDKRAPSLVKQALAPVVNPAEMNGDLTKILARLNAVSVYADGFRAVFGNGAIDAAKLEKALGAFMMTIVAETAPVDRKALRSDRYEQGKALFFGKARCTSCHAGANFSDDVVRDTGLGRAVKTPTLRMIASTAPYFHDGRARTLEDVVRFYDDPPLAARGVDADLRPLGLTGGEIEALTTFLKEGFDGGVRFTAPE